ncbi:protein D2-like isoform X2 [Bemisia tabaci]
MEPPLMEWPADSEYQYTLIMTDPDVPNRTTPYEKEWQNWIVVNIPGCKFTDGEVLTEYIPPLPDQIYGGVHRVVFLAYKQPLLDIIFREPELGEEQTSYEHRGKFSTEKFAKKYKLGDPVAVNFFYLRWSNID